MDPLSVSASIIALLQLSSTVITYLSDIKDGPQELQRIRLETSSVLHMLILLQDQADQSKEDEPFSSTLRSLNVPNGPFKQLHVALEYLASRLVPVQGWKRIKKAFNWPFEKEAIHDILETIERQKTILSLARQNDHIALSKAIRDNIETTQGRVDNVSMQVTDLQNGERLKEIRRWLSAPDPSSNYSKALENRHADTGDWFIKSSAYSNWLSKSGSFLWLYGNPGCGKTILSSTIIQRTIGYCQSRTNSAVLYFYFDFNDIEKQQYGKMVRSLIIQISEQSASTPQILEKLYPSYMNGARQPVYDSLLSTLHQIVENFEETYLVIDALDECRERQGLLRTIEELTGWEDTSLHVLMTSRREKVIEESMELLTDPQGRLCIQSAQVASDIRAYVHHRLETDRDLRRWRDKPEVQREIEDSLLSKADGMFRWAACQLDSLRNCLNLSGLRKTLMSLPITLDDTYTRVLCSIDEVHYQYAFRILQWLTYSARPLELREVAEVIAIDINESPRFNPMNRLPEPRDILTVCSSLISLDIKTFAGVHKESNYEKNKIVVRLAHFSVKEYLTSDRILEGVAQRYSISEIEANISIQNDCLAYLLEFDASNSSDFESLAKSPLANYAAEYWIRHAQVAERHASFSPDLTIELFLTEGDALLNWIRLYDPDDEWEEFDRNRSSSSLCPSLYYASLAGLRKTARILLKEGANVNAQDGHYGNALQAASNEGYDEIVQILLDEGADVNAQSGWWGNALGAAIVGEHRQVINILLDNGADISAGGEFGDALQAASVKGQWHVLQILLKEGANVNAQGGVFSTALLAASYGGHDRATRLLLDEGADINAQGGQYGNALQAASGEGRDQVVQILLEKGAVVNSLGGYYGNALQAASAGGHDKVVRILLEKGADVNAPGGHYGNALQAALHGGHDEVVHILLEKGADVNAPGGHCGNALQAALFRGHDKIINTVLEKGAKVNVSAHDGY